jgi:hypothetical protein
MRNYSRRQQTQSRKTYKRKQRLRQRQRQSRRYRGGRWFNKTRSFFEGMYNKTRGRKDQDNFKTTTASKGSSFNTFGHNDEEINPSVQQYKPSFFSRIVGSKSKSKKEFNELTQRSKHTDDNFYHQRAF